MQYNGCSHDGGIIGKNAFEYLTKFEHEEVTISYTTPELGNWMVVTEEDAKRIKDNILNCGGACANDYNNPNETVTAIA